MIDRNRLSDAKNKMFRTRTVIKSLDFIRNLHKAAIKGVRKDDEGEENKKT